MPLAFTCPSCGHETLVADQFEGRSGPCGRCGQIITVPRGLRRTPGEGPRSEWAGLALLLATAGIGVLAAIGIWLVGFELARPLVERYGAVLNRGGCEANLKKIGAALLAYHQQYGSFPPAYIPDDKGQPAHSWRVLILPFLGHKALYNRYSFKEPYNGPNNAALTLEMPPEFGCPADSDLTGSEMSYQVIMGPGTAFPGATAKGLDDISDDPATTILVVEMTNPRGFSWINPVDIRESGLTPEINGTAGSLMSQHEPGGVHVLTADGKVHFLRDSTPGQVLRAMISIRGGEQITPDMLGE